MICYTHTHKGHICLKKDRYIITGYVNFVRKGERIMLDIKELTMEHKNVKGKSL